MGNGTSKRPSLQTNVVNTSSRDLVGDNYIVDQAIGEGKSTQIRRATTKKYTKTERTSGVAIKLWDGKSDIQTDLKLEAEILGKEGSPKKLGCLVQHKKQNLFDLF